MKNSSVVKLLFYTIIILIIIPLIGTFYFLNHTINTTLNLTFNSEMNEVIDQYSYRLKELKSKDPSRSEEYKKEFEKLQDLKIIYSNSETTKNNLNTSLMIYFGLGILGAILLALIIAWILSLRISGMYSKLMTETIEQKNKIQYLDGIKSWQEFARILAHEIKNPLTPIELLISNLKKSYLRQNKDGFLNQLTQTEFMVLDELGHLKSLVNRFSEFAKVPKIELVNTNISHYLNHLKMNLNLIFNGVEICWVINSIDQTAVVYLDQTLFKQVFINIIKNGLEANLGKNINFKVLILKKESNIYFQISNSGAPLFKELQSRIFEPYVSSHASKENMGLGLSIVRKIIIEHGGDIEYLEIENGPVFEFWIPLT